jgi:integrase-like protein
MAGADPSLERSTTITADIVPVNVVVDGQTFSGTNVVQPVLDSPVFASNDYTFTPFVTNTLDGTTNHSFTTGGPLSGGNTNNQLEDATMRSQFGKQGTGYHLLLHPVVLIKPVGPHTLRHAFITAALDAGVPLRDVQEAASHADPRTTMRYDRARAAWTGTRPTSSPPTSLAPPGKN